MFYDIITFGSATLDIFLKTKEFSVEAIKKFITKKGLCFPFSSKVDVDGLYFFSGGGGTNGAAFFALQGLKTAYCGMVGKDFAGQEILKELKHLGVDTDLIKKTNNKTTNLSVIFSFGQDRTVFVWRQASEKLTKKQIPWKKLNTTWFYLAPLSGKSALLFEPLVDFAFRQKIKIFANPGNSQIKLAKKLKPILNKIDILLLNQEEASLLTGIPYQKEEKIFKKLDKLVPGIAIMTKGKRGAIVSDGNYLWRAKAPQIKVIEKTGAGDALGSGFLASYIKNKDVEKALQFGIANASACIQKIGAKQGLLKKGQYFKKAKIVRAKL